jgi:ACS family sodium-dependent inorganic phosphate cotransporter
MCRQGVEFAARPGAWYSPAAMWSRRFTLVAFCSTCLALSYMDRFNLSVAAPLLMREFGWSAETLGFVQSVFFYGFTLSHLPGGWLADRFGGRRILGGGVLAWTLATAATPVVGGMGGLVSLRAVLGLGEGVNMPSISSLVAGWFPPHERTRAMVVNLTGIQAGTLLTAPLSAWIAATYGWRAIFYTYALLGIVWLGLWSLWCQRTRGHASPITPSSASTKINWTALLRRPAVVALLVITFVTNWTVWFVHSWLPTYLMQAHGFSLKDSGLIAAVPNLAMIAAGLASGWIADGLIGRGVSVTRVRKLMLASGFSGASLLFLQLPHASSATGAVAYLTGALACFALGSTTVVVNALDLAPRRAGVMLGLQGTAGNVAGMVSPYLGGAIVTRTGTWDLNFYVIAALLAVGLVVWTLLASGEEIPFLPEPVR